MNDRYRCDSNASASRSTRGRDTVCESVGTRDTVCESVINDPRILVSMQQQSFIGDADSLESRHCVLCSTKFGEHQWAVRKSYRDCLLLHQKLTEQFSDTPVFGQKQQSGPPHIKSFFSVRERVWLVVLGGDTYREGG
jgi:hypothetical protein